MMDSEKIIELMISEGKISKEEIEVMVEVERRKSPFFPLKEDVKSLKETNDVALFAVAEAYETQFINDMQRQEEAAVNMGATAEIFELMMMLEMRLAMLEEGGEK